MKSLLIEVHGYVYKAVRYPSLLLSEVLLLLLHATFIALQVDWTAKVQAISSIGTLVVSIIGFVFLIRQLQQFNENMKHDAYSKHIEDYSKITQLLIEKPHLNRFFYGGSSGFNELQSDEQDFYNYVAMSVGFFERLFLLHQKRWIEKETWDTWKRWFREQWFPLKVFQVFWENEGKYFHQEFFKAIDLDYRMYLSTRKQSK